MKYPVSSSTFCTACIHVALACVLHAGLITYVTVKFASLLSVTFYCSFGNKQRLQNILSTHYTEIRIAFIIPEFQKLEFLFKPALLIGFNSAKLESS